MSVEDYVSKFYNLVARNQLNESGEQLLSRFTKGLNRLIQYWMIISTFTMVEEIQQTLTVERCVLRSSRAPPPRQPIHF